MPNVTKLEDISLPRVDFCKLLGGVSPRTVEKWVETGLPRQAVGKARWRYGYEAILWAWALNRKNGKKPGGLQLEKQRLEVEKLQMDVDREKGTLLHVDDFDSVLADLCTRFNAKIRAVPRKWAPDLIGVESMPQVVDVLDRLVEELRAELKVSGDD